MEQPWQPHDPLPVEKTWNAFIRTVSGKLISEMISQTPDFENADYLFERENIIIELKEVETDFGRQSGIIERVDHLHDKIFAEDPNWKPRMFGGEGKYPAWFSREYLSIFRKPVSRIIEKANRQIKSTKKQLGKENAQGIMLFVNDGFASLSPELVHATANDLLTRSYSSIDCFVYLTVNRYVCIAGSDLAYLVWIPTYKSDDCDQLSNFINELGRKWLDYLENQVGSFIDRQERPDYPLEGSKSIIP